MSRSDLPTPDLDAEAIGIDIDIDIDIDADIAALSELTAAGVQVDGQVRVAESTWVVYGHTSYDGEIAVGVYRYAYEASEVLRAVSSGHPVQNGVVR